MRRFTRPDEVSEALGIEFSEQQLAAITAPLEPGVIIAGAGSGKTTVMAARVVWLVGTGLVRPEQVLGLTFTRKAAAELSSRVRAALLRSGVLDSAGVDDAGEQLVMTYDAFAARIVDDHGLRIGVEGGTRMITGAGRWRLASRVVTQAPGPFESLTRLRPDSVTERVLELDSALRSHLVDTPAIREHTDEFVAEVAQAPTTRGNTYASLRTAASAAAERAELAGLADAYSAAKASAGVTEFADQMAVAARLCRDTPAVSAALRAEFAVVLLDEYQDTSSAQAQLLSSLFSGAEAADGLGHPVTAVGDPCQAIYGWRGAAASNITEYARCFPRADGSPATSYALTVNRRSGQRILDAANDLAAPLRQDPDLAWDGIDVDLVAPEGTPPGDITVAAFGSWPAEVAWVADEIVAAHDAGRVRTWADIAVLTRRNEHIGGIFAELRERGVPVEIVGLGGLLDVPEVADVVAVLRVLADVTDNPALLRVLTGPRWAIGPGDLRALGARAVELSGRRRRPGADMTFAEGVRATLESGEPSAVPSLVEALADLGDGAFSAEGRERFSACADELHRLRRHAGEPVTDVVRRVIDTLGLDVEVALAGPDGGRQLAAFVAAVSDYTDVDGDGSLTGLVGYLDAERDHGTGLDQAVVSDADSVKLLTIHRAKGLEWELVVLPALADKVFPSDRATGNWLTSSGTLPADLRGDAASVPQLDDVTDAATKQYRDDLKDELRRGDDRLAYVAVTRARQHLIATTHAWYPGLARPRAQSPYWNTLRQRGDCAVFEEPPPENPDAPRTLVRPWPQPLDPEAFTRRVEAADAVTAARRSLAAGVAMPDAVATLDDAAIVASWDHAAETLLAELRAARRGPARLLPPYLSATDLVALGRDRDEFVRDVARPMPRAPLAATRQGERFHAWLERRFSGEVSLPDVLDDPPPGARLDALIDAFESGPWADRVPIAVEVPFALVLGGRVVRGRIDAVYTDRGRPEVVDWKTGQARRADPVQLAVYRLAWAELTGTDPAAIDVAFVDVLTGRAIRPGGLPDRGALESLVAGSPPGELT